MTKHQEVSLTILRDSPTSFFLCIDSGSGSDLGSIFNSSSPVYCTAQRAVSILNVMSQLWDLKIRQS